MWIFKDKFKAKTIHSIWKKENYLPYRLAHTVKTDPHIRTSKKIIFGPKPHHLYLKITKNRERKYSILDELARYLQFLHNKPGNLHCISVPGEVCTRKQITPKADVFSVFAKLKASVLIFAIGKIFMTDVTGQDGHLREHFCTRMQYIYIY